MIDRPLRDALHRAAGAPVLLIASDYDGTLSPIVDDPAAAIPHDAALATLIEACDLPGVTGLIISGRSLDVLARLTGAPDSITLIGTHGAQSEHAVRPDPDTSRAISELTEELREIADTHDGAVLELKPSGAALHYRHVEDPGAMLATVADVASHSDARVIEGKKVVEFVIGDGDKGTAVEQHRASVSADIVVFFGDDVTDEDVFALLGSDDVGVKVGPEATLARYRVDDPDGVAEALKILVSERRSIRK